MSIAKRTKMHRKGSIPCGALLLAFIFTGKSFIQEGYFK